MRQLRIRAGQQRVRSAVVAVALVVLVTGCSSEAEQPSAELPPASSSAAETTPELPPLGPVDFPVPDEARTQDEAGAEAFFRYFVDLVNRQQTVPTGEGIRELAPECTDCLGIARRFDDAAKANYTIDGGELAIVGEPGIGFHDDRVEFSFIAEIEPIVAYDASGAIVSDSKASAQKDLSCGLRLSWSRERSSWLVSALTVG